MVKKAEHQGINFFELCVVLEKTLESPLECKEREKPVKEVQLTLEQRGLEQHWSTYM